LARQARISGDVQAKAFSTQTAQFVTLKFCLGHPLLRESARKNALLWKFQWAGPQASDTLTLNYQYRLEGELQEWMDP